MTNLQIEHLVERWEDRRDVKNQMGKFVHYLLLKQEAKIVDDLWSEREDICYGVNEGWYQGREAVKGFFDWFPGHTAKVAACIKAKFPKELGDKSDDEIFGVGLMELKSISNYVIEVAEDGESAKGFCCLFGFNTTVDTRGPISNWILGTIAVDFVYENDQWKILHMQYLEDIDRPAGTDWGTKEPATFPDLPEFEALRGQEPPKPNVQKELHQLYSGTRAKTVLPPLPVPYTTFAETFSYGI
jgi:hypothetical protein